MLVEASRVFARVARITSIQHRGGGTRRRSAHDSGGDPGAGSPSRVPTMERGGGGTAGGECRDGGPPDANSLIRGALDGEMIGAERPSPRRDGC